ncbi:uncharacterized protein LOC107610304 [Arachis ipaensis]|uniref:uncharacterized protein LOC107610304 n=1 Tax=Arachis ipaensis TaxID=130454 RepID=UPI000A2B899D|nr:uncharacterized protein LOC107610304 [Arachis ipaensis]
MSPSVHEPPSGRTENAELAPPMLTWLIGVPTWQVSEMEVLKTGHISPSNTKRRRSALGTLVPQTQEGLEELELHTALPWSYTHPNGDATTLTTTPNHHNNHPVLTLHLKDPILEQNSDTLFTPTPTMASTNSTNSTDPLPSPDDIAAKALTKRFDALITVRTKAIKGKGAWYWTHLEPILVRNPDSGAPKSVKLKCSLCDSVFSASNPSRTASEHLKRGTCPNFSTGLRPGSVPSPLPISVVNTGSNHSNNSRKRASPASPVPYQNHALAMVESSKFGPFGGEIGYTQVHGNSVNQHHHHNQHQHHQQQQHLVLSGGKEDLCALAMFEDSVKKLKSPKTSPGPALSKEQVNSALELLSDWLCETCGSVSLATIEHRKFQAFLSQVGLPATNTLRREISGPRLDAKFSEAKAESEAKIRDAMFFQVASDGWKNMNWYSLCCGGENLVKFVVNLPNGTSVFQKALFTGGVVSSSYAEEVLWETVTGASGSVVQRCVGIVADKFKAKALRNLEAQNHWMVNTSCQLQGFISLIKDFNNEGFWNELEAVYSIVKVIRGMIQDIEAERPLIGRCLPLWEELRTKVKEWCSKYNIAEGPVEKLMCPGTNVSRAERRRFVLEGLMCPVFKTSIPLICHVGTPMSQVSIGEANSAFSVRSEGGSWTEGRIDLILRNVRDLNVFFNAQGRKCFRVKR